MKNLDPMTTLDQELQKDIDRILTEKNKSVMGVEYKGRHLWLKQSKQTRSKGIQRLGYSVTRLKTLLPVEKKSAQKAMHFEVAKLQRLSQKGLQVPKVIGYNDRYFVMTDTGHDLHTYLKNDKFSLSYIESILEKCVTLLSRIHNAGEYHAGPQIKNYTIKNDRLYAIDFEDSFPGNCSLKDLLFRDLILFLISLSSLGRQVDYKSLVNIYKSLTRNNEIDTYAKKIAGRLNFIVKILETDTIYKQVSQDVRDACHLLKALQNL